MPITDNKYVSPGWVNEQPPAIDADELNAISETLQMQGAIGTVDTAADVVAKTVSISDIANKIIGMTVGLTFTNGNTATNPTLNINGFGAASIYYAGDPIMPDMIRAGEFYLFKFDGTYWQIINPSVVSIIETFGTIKTEVITQTGVWHCPKGVKKVFARLFGGGGGGTTANYSLELGVAGGGGGYMAAEIIYVTPDTDYVVTIGAGANSGGTGGTTSFGSLLSANGGKPAKRTGYNSDNGYICLTGGDGGSGGGGGGVLGSASAAVSLGGCNGGNAQYGGGGGAGDGGKGGDGGTYGGGGGAGNYGSSGGNGGTYGGRGGSSSASPAAGTNTVNMNLEFTGTGAAGTNYTGGLYGQAGGGGGGYGGNGGNASAYGGGGGGGYGANGGAGLGSNTDGDSYHSSAAGGGGGYGGAANGAGGGGYGSANYGCGGSGNSNNAKAGVCILTYVDPITNDIEN